MKLNLLQRLLGGKYILGCESIPNNYGIAYRMETHYAVICYPVPIHLFMRWIKQAWDNIRYKWYYKYRDKEVWDKESLQWRYYNIASCSYNYAKAGSPKWQSEEEFLKWFGAE